MSPQNCTSCRHARTDKQKRPVEATGFGDQILFADEDEVVYTCQAPSGERSGQFIGVQPATCSVFELPLSGAGVGRLAEIDKLIAQRDERARRSRDGD